MPTEEQNEEHELETKQDLDSRSSTEVEDDDDDAESSKASIRLSQEYFAAANLPWMMGASKGGVPNFIHAIKEEVASDVRYGFAHLALFYVVMNNMVRNIAGELMRRI